MIEQEFLNKILKILPKDPNQISNWACQEDFFLSLPIHIFNRIITTVIAGSQSSASSLRAYINLNGIQKKNIRIIHEANFSSLRPYFDVVIIEKNSTLVSHFIDWLNDAKYYNHQKIKVFKKSSVVNIHSLNLSWDHFTKNWVYKEIAFDINISPQQNKKPCKFVNEEIEDNENE